jgi:hypothetical protein
MSLYLIAERVIIVTAFALLCAPPPAVQAQDAPPAVATSEMSGLHGIFGDHVRDLNGDDVGRLWDILVDDEAKPRAAVINYGGTLGMGERKVAVAWSTLQLVVSDTDAPVHLALTKQQLGMLPEFKYGTATAVVGNGH